MKKTLQKINELVALNIIDEYAITGGIAHFYYIEPSVTYDLDLIVNVNKSSNSLMPFEEIYKWTEKNNYKSEKEHILIEGIPVQFLLPYNDLIAEALKNKKAITIFNEDTFIIEPEYLMAIMIQTGRASDKERLVRFVDEAVFDKQNFLEIISKFNLYEIYKKIIS